MDPPSGFQEKLRAEQAQQGSRDPTLASGLHFLPKAPTQDLHRQVMNCRPLPNLDDSLGLAAQLKSTQLIRCTRVHVP